MSNIIKGLTKEQITKITTPNMKVVTPVGVMSPGTGTHNQPQQKGYNPPNKKPEDEKKEPSSTLHLIAEKYKEEKLKTKAEEKIPVKEESELEIALKKLFEKREDIFSKFNYNQITQALSDNLIEGKINFRQAIQGLEMGHYDSISENLLQTYGDQLGLKESRPYNPLDRERREQAAMDAERRDFKRRELEAELAGEEERAERYNQGPWYVLINGKVVKDKNKQPYTFNTLQAATKAVNTMKQKDWNKGKEFSYSRSPTDKVDETVNEGVIYQLDKEDPLNKSEILVLGGAGRYTFDRLREKARREAEQLYQDLQVNHPNAFTKSAYNVKQLENTLKTIAAAYEEMETIRKQGGVRSRNIKGVSETSSTGMGGGSAGIGGGAGLGEEKMSIQQVHQEIDGAYKAVMASLQKIWQRNPNFEPLSDEEFLDQAIMYGERALGFDTKSSESLAAALIPYWHDYHWAKGGLKEANPIQQFAKYKPSGTTYRQKAMPTLDPDPVDKARPLDKAKNIPADLPDPNEEINLKQLRKALDQLLADQSFTPRERYIIKSHYINGKTFTQLAKELNLSLERVIAINARTERKLRHPARKDTLRSFFDFNENTNQTQSIYRLGKPSTSTIDDPPDEVVEYPIYRDKKLVGQLSYSKKYHQFYGNILGKSLDNVKTNFDGSDMMVANHYFYQYLKSISLQRHLAKQSDVSIKPQGHRYNQEPKFESSIMKGIQQEEKGKDIFDKEVHDLIKKIWHDKDVSLSKNQARYLVYSQNTGLEIETNSLEDAVYSAELLAKRNLDSPALVYDKQTKFPVVAYNGSEDLWYQKNRLHEGNSVNEYEVEKTRKIVYSKENPPPLDFLYRQFLHNLLSSTNKLTPQQWIDMVNKQYGLNYKYTDYQTMGHKDPTNNWDKIIKKFVLKK